MFVIPEGSLRLLLPLLFLFVILAEDLLLLLPLPLLVLRRVAPISIFTTQAGAPDLSHLEIGVFAEARSLAEANQEDSTSTLPATPMA